MQKIIPGEMKNVLAKRFSAFSRKSDVKFTTRPTVGTARRNPSTLNYLVKITKIVTKSSYIYNQIKCGN